MATKQHWEEVYQKRDSATDLSWYQRYPTKSLELILACGSSKSHPVLDIGGGASLLVDSLLEARFERVSVLDISSAALAISQERLGTRASQVTWIEADVTRFAAPHRYYVWHDRAVLHFLTEPEERAGYLRSLRNCLMPGGYLVMATFAKDGPSRCSGLPVVRYDAQSLCELIGPGFELLEQKTETHVTPWHTEQRFGWYRLQRQPIGDSISVLASAA
jgi:ubiquinone/menaquinone biosynthesis C-methylase UbiE